MFYRSFVYFEPFSFELFFNILWIFLTENYRFLMAVLAVMCSNPVWHVKLASIMAFY